MDSDTAEAHPNAARPMADAKSDRSDEHEHSVEEREAYEAWGYMFKPDKTGTDKLKALLRGLKDTINEHYEPSDNPDLTPTQLAGFYRDLDGNYDQLFLGTPGASIAFIYKSLGCLHSLQPLPHSVTFTDPTVPALKTEGWIMWQTIQILLGPEEHSKFLMEAVRRWDIKDPNNGETLPKILPRQCFPASPDKHMVAWYEGVSERLRTEAEEEIRRVEDEKEADRSRVTVRGHDTDDEGSVDSRGPALAYFRNPLYRHVDAGSTAAPPRSRRPTASPRPSSLRGKSKEAASKFGHVMKNVASPHLWDGHAHGHERDPEHRHGSRTGSRDRDRERKRRSMPHHLPGDPPPERDPYDEQLPPPGPMQPPRHSCRRSSRVEPRPTISRPDEDWDADDNAPSVHSRDPSPRRSRAGPRDFNDPHVRHSKSHEPTPTQRDADDYFQPEDPTPPSRRRASAYEDSPDAPPRQPGFGPSFVPSAAPLFASHVARQPPPPQASREQPLPGPPPPPPMNYDPRQYPGPPNRRLRPPRHPDMDPPPNRSRTRPHSSRSPPRRRGSRPSGSRPVPPYDDHYPSPGRNPGPEPRRRSRPPPPGPVPRHDGPRDYPPDGPGREPRRRSRPPPGPPPRYGDPRDDLYSSGEESITPPPSPDDRRSRRHSSRRSRGGGADGFDEADGFHSAPEGPDRRGGPGRPKVTRFADAPMSGVDGRRYPEAPWR